MRGCGDSHPVARGRMAIEETESRDAAWPAPPTSTEQAPDLHTAPPATGTQARRRQTRNASALQTAGRT